MWPWMDYKSKVFASATKTVHTDFLGPGIIQSSIKSSEVTVSAGHLCSRSYFLSLIASSNSACSFPASPTYHLGNSNGNETFSMTTFGKLCTILSYPVPAPPCSIPCTTEPCFPISDRGGKVFYRHSSPSIWRWLAAWQLY